MNTEEMWDCLVEIVDVPEETLRIVTDVAGYSTETMEAVLYSVTGYQDFDQLDEAD